MQITTDIRLRENFLTLVQGDKSQVDMTQQDIMNRVKSRLFDASDPVMASAHKDILADHHLQYLLEPINVYSTKFKFLASRDSFTPME